MRSELRLAALLTWIPLGVLLDWMAQPGGPLFHLGSAIFVSWALVTWLLATAYFGQFPAPKGSARWSAVAVIVLSWGLMTGVEMGMARKQVQTPESEREWMRSRDDVRMLLDFMENYPDSEHVAEARKVLRDGEDRFWAQAIGEQVAEMRRPRIWTYLEAYPGGIHALEARQRLDDEEWAVARNAKRDGALVEYITRFSKGRHVAEARALLVKSRQ